MEICDSTTTLDKLVRHYSEWRDADIVFRIHYRREPAGACEVFRLVRVDELGD